MNANSPGNMRAALAFVLGAGLCTSMVAQTQAPAAISIDTVADNEIKMEAFSVVGSRIKRLDTETPSPTVRITAAEFEATGFTNVDDALRALPFNNAVSLTGDNSANSFASGTSTVNLRGLGNNNTLVLINGRRAVPSGSGVFNGFQSVIDLRQIPTSAIEELQVLKDGASAIYGSDAVAGVINIQLKRNFTGLGVDLSYGNTFKSDSNEVTAFLIAGAHTGKTSIVVTADFNRRAALMNRDFPWSRTADLRLDKTGTSFFELDGAGRLVGFDRRSSFGFPAVFLVPGTATARTFGSRTNDPNPNNAVATSRVTGAGFYDYQQDSSLTPESETRGMGLYMRHDFSESLYGFADIFFKRIETVNYAAPSPFQSTDRGGGPTGRLIVPASNPYNPYGTRYFGAAGQAIELTHFRAVNSGPRVVDAVSDYPRYLFGLGGTLPNSWTWESAYMFARGSYDNTSPGTGFDSRLQEAFNGLNIGGQVLYANPFGAEDPRVTDYYTGTNPTSTRFTSNLYDISASGDLFNLPAGAVGAAVGMEYRTEMTTDVRTLENETGNIIGGSEGFGFEGKRNVTSAYAELKVPILSQLEGQLAARWEDYSDFGNTTKPKVALAYRPTNWLLLRGSYSESFKAPDLAFLYSAGNVGFTSGIVADPRRPDMPPAQLKILGRGNKNLKPEETETTSVGFVVDVPRGLFKGLSFDVSYFEFDQKNLIRRDTATFTLTNELLLPAGRVARRGVTPAEVAAGITVGTIEHIANDWYNANSAVNAGWDFGVAYRYNHREWGNFRFSANATYADKFELESTNSLGATTVIDIDGTDSVPLWRGNASVGWNRGDWAASVFLTYIGSYPMQAFAPTPAYDVEEQIRVNPQVSWRSPWKTRFTVGVRNIFNEEPPRYLGGAGGYNDGVNPVEPAFWYVRASHEF